MDTLINADCPIESADSFSKIMITLSFISGNTDRSAFSRMLILPGKVVSFISENTDRSAFSKILIDPHFHYQNTDRSAFSSEYWSIHIFNNQHTDRSVFSCRHLFSLLGNSVGSFISPGPSPNPVFWVSLVCPKVVLDGTCVWTIHLVQPSWARVLIRCLGWVCMRVLSTMYCQYRPQDQTPWIQTPWMFSPS